ncbi:MAG TPA: hypothetical protein VMN36_07385 [Verrucomicrobiales bacterium]|nr:hypothetical protein [Verrucomicrobiales bacterium]
MKASPRLVAAIAAAGCLLAGLIVWLVMHFSPGTRSPDISAEERSAPDLHSQPGPAEALEPFDRARPWEGLTPGNAPGRLEALQQDPIFWERVLPGFYRGWGTMDGPAAMAAAEQELAQRRATATRMALLGWAAAEEAEALSWIEAQPDGPDRANQMRNLIRGHDPADPSEFVSWVHQRFGDQDEDGTLLRSLAGLWAKEDPRAGAQWLATLPENAHLAAAAESLFATWGKIDAESSSRFLSEEMPPGSLRDSAISAFSRSIATLEPEAALAWAGAIGDAELRERTVDLVAGMQPAQAVPPIPGAIGLPEGETAENPDLDSPEDADGADSAADDGEEGLEPSGETDGEAIDPEDEPQDQGSS